ISGFITQLRNIHPQISGKDLKKMGIEPGPVYGKILQEIKAAQIDGHLPDRQAQLEWVKKNYT
ncbi:MAG: hypothetical protein ACLFT1_08510, partial [Desulfonatronovibrio sp.]